MTGAALPLLPPPWPGIGVYLGLTFLFSWVPAVALDTLWGGTRDVFPTRLLHSSTYYFLTMGWQPFLAVLVVRRWIDPPGYLDLGLNPTRYGILVLGTAGALSIAALSVAITWLAGLPGLAVPTAIGPGVESDLPSRPSLGAAVILGVALAGTIVLLCVQAFCEELGWRGYFLTRMMQRFGPWPGLLLHGSIWGVWYAPIIALAAGNLAAVSSDSVSFIVTCTLLGGLFGWLRLLVRSITLAVVVNAVLTIAAGLPFILSGVDVGPRGSAYGPAGWIPVLLAAGVLFIGPARRAVTVPRAFEPRGARVGLSRVVEHLVSRNGVGSNGMARSE
jgi:membrane protease YdiL (CAAX protease family)